LVWFLIGSAFKSQFLARILLFASAIIAEQLPVPVSKAIEGLVRLIPEF
jgi:hypothetical protein